MMDRYNDLRNQANEIGELIEKGTDSKNFVEVIYLANDMSNVLTSIPAQERKSIDYWNLDFAYYSLAQAHFKLKNFPLALQFTEKAIDALNHVSNSTTDLLNEEMEKNVSMLREIYLNQNQDELVAEASVTSIDILNRMKHRSLDVYNAMLESLIRLINVNTRIGDYGTIVNLEEHLDELLNVFAEHKFPRGMLNLIGGAYNRVGDAWNKLTDFEIEGESNPEKRDRMAQKKALEYFAQIDKGEMTESINRNIGMTHYYLGKNYIEAEKNSKASVHFILALESWKDVDDIHESDEEELLDTMLQLGVLLKDANSVEALLNEFDQKGPTHLSLSEVFGAVRLSQDISKKSSSSRKTEIRDHEAMIVRSDEDNHRLGMLHYHQAQMYMLQLKKEKALMSLFDALFVWKELENIHNINRCELVSLLTSLGSYLQSEEMLLEMFNKMENMSESEIESDIESSLSEAESDEEMSLSSVESDAGSENTDSYDARSGSSSRSSRSSESSESSQRSESSESSNVVSLQNSSTMFAGKRKRMTAEQRTLQEAQEYLKDHPSLSKVIHRR